MILAWDDVASCRPAPALGMAGAWWPAIPYTVVEDWLDRRGYQGMHRELLRHLLGRMDSWWREMANSRTDKEGESS